MTEINERELANLRADLHNALSNLESQRVADPVPVERGLLEGIRKDRDAQEDYADRQRAALEKHGVHGPSCPVQLNTGPNCTCGLDAALADKPSPV